MVLLLKLLGQHVCLLSRGIGYLCWVKDSLAVLCDTSWPSACFSQLSNWIFFPSLLPMLVFYSPYFGWLNCNLSHSGKRNFNGRVTRFKFGPWAYLQGIILVASSCRRVQPAMGGTISNQVVLVRTYHKRKVTEHKAE